MPSLNLKVAKDNTGTPDRYDAIVIGSGVTGGWAAKELTEKGLTVLMLERGRKLDHVTDYENATKAPWELEHAGMMTMQQKADHPKLTRDGFYDATTDGYWMKDTDALYHEDKRFDWFRPTTDAAPTVSTFRATAT